MAYTGVRDRSLSAEPAAGCEVVWCASAMSRDDHARPPCHGDHLGSPYRLAGARVKSLLSACPRQGDLVAAVSHPLATKTQPPVRLRWVQLLVFSASRKAADRVRPTSTVLGQLSSRE